MTITKDKKIGVLYGGFSNERAVSLRSGKNIHSALERLGYDARLIDPAETQDWLKGYDVAFIALHGKFGEDGTVQTLLEAAGIPYVGSGVSASVRCYNKYVCKWILKEKGIPTPPFIMSRVALTQIPHGFMYPVITKPIEEGSSVGVTVSDNDEELWENTKALEAEFGNYILEPFFENNKEVTVGIIEDPMARALPILELRPKNRFYDYDAKYTPGKTEFVLPAELSKEETLKIQALAVKTHEIMGCRGFNRIDMIIDAKTGPYVIDINTIPGFTDTSDLPAQAKEAGINFDALVQIILNTVAS